MADRTNGVTPTDYVGIGAAFNPAAHPLNSITPNGTYENSRIVKQSAGVLYGLAGFNSKGSSQFIQIFDARAVPLDGGFPVLFLTVPTVGNYSVDFGSLGMQFANGIVICNSTTGPTKTIGLADCFIAARYR